MTSERGFGWIKQKPDVRDYLMTDPLIRPHLRVVPIKALPSNYTGLKQYVDKIPVRDQMNYGACTSFAGAGIMEFYDESNPLIKNTMDFSEMYLYYFNRYVMNGDTPPSGDEGCTIRDTMTAMQVWGIGLESAFAYTTQNFDKQPSQVVIDTAKTYDVSKYFIIPDDIYKVNAIKQSIYAGVPVMAGWDVHESIFHVGSDGLEPYASSNSVNDPLAGGHARYLWGWDDAVSVPGTTSKGAFYVRNSWGPSWGAKGNSLVPYKTFTDQQIDAMGITSANYPAPTPPPKPTPGPKPTPSDCTAFKAALRQFITGYKCK